MLGNEVHFSVHRFFEQERTESQISADGSRWQVTIEQLLLVAVATADMSKNSRGAIQDIAVFLL